jgi:hypothetical protein
MRCVRRTSRKSLEQLIPGYGHPGGALRAILLSKGARVYIRTASATGKSFAITTKTFIQSTPHTLAIHPSLYPRPAPASLGQRGESLKRG